MASFKPFERLFERLLVTPREASRALSISERKLWQMTADGEISCVRIGRAVRYEVADLRVLIAQQKKRANV